jgi:hypothetical protein
MKKLVILFIAIAGFAVNSLAQVSATASASAFIVTPIAISKTLDMNFGNVAVNNTPGTVVLTTASARSVTGGCTLPAVTGTVQAASFAVTGTAAYTYAITLPVALFTVVNGANSMTVNTWTSNPTPTGVLSAGGTQTLLVGATLNVGANQASGLYTSAADFTVTVNYN